VDDEFIIELRVNDERAILPKYQTVLSEERKNLLQRMNIGA
jgi:hypothetical protein